MARPRRRSRPGSAWRRTSRRPAACTPAWSSTGRSSRSSPIACRSGWPDHPRRSARAGALGRGDKLAAGYCVRVDRAGPGGVSTPCGSRTLVEVLDPLPLIDRKMLELTRWLAEYYACSWGQALDAAVPAGVKKHAGTRVGTFLVVPEETREALRAGPIVPKLSAKQAAVLDVLCRGDEPLTTADVCRLAKCSSVPGPGAAEARAGAHGPPTAAAGYRRTVRRARVATRRGRDAGRRRGAIAGRRRRRGHRERSPRWC